MLLARVYLVLTFVFGLFAQSLACKGCLSLDEYNFDKIISRFKAVLVKFDVAYPYGEKHDTFAKLAEEIASNKDIVFAQVGVKDYGDKENEELAKKYGISGKDDFPAVLLFVSGQEEPIPFSNDVEFSIDNLRNLIRDNTDIYIGLPGCLEEYDKLAIKFSSSGNKEPILKESESLLVKLKEDGEKSTAEVYIKFMKKIIENGFNFVSQEVKRLNKILKDGKVNEKKKKDLYHRVNILHSFSIKKDEL